jgi:hypothetical protein
MEDWNPGDTAICIDNSPVNGADGNPLRKGSEYMIQAITKCKCGGTFFNVGISSSSFFTKTGTTFTCCGEETSDGIWWFAARRFTKKKTLQATEFKEVSYSKVIETEKQTAN